MNGKFVAGFIVIFALATGAMIYWLQEYAFYTEASFQPGSEIDLTLLETGQPEPILADNVQGIDATSSPLRFRACFHTPMSQAMLTETYKAVSYTHLDVYKRQHQRLPQPQKDALGITPGLIRLSVGLELSLIHI